MCGDQLNKLCVYTTTGKRSRPQLSWDGVCVAGP